jgi:GT2 family glycosyltransferase
MKPDKVGKNKIKGSYHISDDYDINIRAIAGGFKGAYVPEAVVIHDQSRVNTLPKLIMYFWGQYVRTSMAYFKHKQSTGKFVKGTLHKKMAHPFEGFLLLLKVLALIKGWSVWQTMKKQGLYE